MSDRVYIGNDIVDFRNLGLGKPISKITLMYDDENGFSAGDDTGMEIVAKSYFATQAMVDQALELLRGQKYQAFTADAAGIDPAAELGDAVTVGGIYAQLVCRVDAGYGFPDIEAPGEEELEEDDQCEGPLKRDVKRKLTLGQSYYGTRISKSTGWEVVKLDADGNEIKRATFNADVIALFNANGRKKIYFDAETGEYYFDGNVNVRGGKMNINEKFVVDEDGNATLTDAWLKAAILYAGDESEFYARMMGNAFALMLKGSDVPRAVLQGGSDMIELILGMGTDESGRNGRLYVQKGIEGERNIARVKYIDINGNESKVEFADNEGMTIESDNVRFIGTVDFSQAEVTGLTTG